MSVQVLTPGVKSPDWNVQRAFVAPEWQPLWDDLFWCVPLREGGGETTRNVVDGVPGDITQTGSNNLPAWSTNPHGVGLTFDNDETEDQQGFVSWGSRYAPLLLGAATWFARFSYNVLGGSFSNWVCGAGDATDNESANYLGGIMFYSDSLLGTFWEQGAGANTIIKTAGAFPAAAGEMVDVAVVRYANADVQFYVNGAPFEALNTGNTLPTGGGTTSLLLGEARTTFNLEGWDGDVVTAMAWNRALQPSEVAQLHQDFDGLTRLDLLQFVGKAPAVVGLIIPTAMYSYRRRRAA